jgi:hypothetical protein
MPLARSMVARSWFFAAIGAAALASGCGAATKTGSPQDRSGTAALTAAKVGVR